MNFDALNLILFFANDSHNVWYSMAVIPIPVFPVNTLFNNKKAENVVSCTFLPTNGPSSISIMFMPCKLLSGGYIVVSRKNQPFIIPNASGLLLHYVVNDYTAKSVCIGASHIDCFILGLFPLYILIIPLHSPLGAAVRKNWIDVSLVSINSSQKSWFLV